MKSSTIAKMLSGIHAVLGSMGLTDVAARGFLFYLLSESGGRSEFALRIAEAARGLDVNERTIARWRGALMSAQLESGVKLVDYASGGWRGDIFEPTKYRIDWSVIEGALESKICAT